MCAADGQLAPFGIQDDVLGPRARQWERTRVLRPLIDHRVDRFTRGIIAIAHPRTTALSGQLMSSASLASDEGDADSCISCS